MYDDGYNNDSDIKIKFLVLSEISNEVGYRYFKSILDNFIGFFSFINVNIFC